MADFFGPKQQQLLDAVRTARLDPTKLTRQDEKLLAEAGSGVDAIARPLTADEREVVEKKRQALKVLLSEDTTLRARFKIEFMCGANRSVEKPFRGSIIVFRSGTALHGGGDEVIYPCVDPLCPGFIPPELIMTSTGMAGCPKCQQVWPQTQLKEMLLAVLPAQKWAFVLSRFFVRLGHDADLYLKSAPVDIRNSARMEREKDHGGLQLAVARTRRQPVIYPLDRIYKDLSNGVDLERCFRAFVTA